MTKIPLNEYNRFERKNLDPIYGLDGWRKDGSPTLYQIEEGLLGFSNEIDLTLPPVIFVHAGVSNIKQYLEFWEKYQGLIILLEEDHTLLSTLRYTDELTRFKGTLGSRLLSKLPFAPDQPYNVRYDNFIIVPTANNDPMPLWGLTDSDGKPKELFETSWPKFADLVNRVLRGDYPNLKVTSYDPAIKDQPIKVGGGIYIPDVCGGCVNITLDQLTEHGIAVEPFEGLLYR